MRQRRVILTGASQKRMACAYIADSPLGHVMVIREPAKSRDQEERYHAMIGDIADQTEYAGKRWARDDMKRIMIDEFADEMRKAGTPLHHDGRLIPSEDGTRVIQLGVQSSKFYVGEASQFISFLFAWGDNRGVVWSDPKIADEYEATA